MIGCEHRNLENEDDFFNLVSEHENKILSLLVYNSVWDNCRDVVIIPKSDWGGEGLLGCGVACGLLHRIPIDPTSQASQESAAELAASQEVTQELATLDLNALPSVIPEVNATEPKEDGAPPTGLDLSSLPPIIPNEEQSPTGNTADRSPPKPEGSSTEVIDPATPIEDADSLT